MCCRYGEGAGDERSAGRLDHTYADGDDARVGQGGGLVDGEDWPLWRELLASAVNSARIALDQPVIYRRLHDGLEQPVCLGDCDRPDSGVEKLLAPFPHALFDIGHRDDAERMEHGHQVQADQAVIELHCLWAEVGAFGHP